MTVLSYVQQSIEILMSMKANSVKKVPQLSMDCIEEQSVEESAPSTEKDFPPKEYEEAI